MGGVCLGEKLSTPLRDSFSAARQWHSPLLGDSGRWPLSLWDLDRAKAPPSAHGLGHTEDSSQWL